MRAIDLGLLAVSCLALGACGGGGGGGGGSGGANVPADFALSATQLGFNGVQNGPAPPSQTVTASATGGTFGTNGTISLSTSIGGNAVERADITSCAGSTCSVVVTVRGNLAPGTYTSPVTISGCTNFSCATPVGTPKTLSVTYVVGSGPTLTSPVVVTVVAAPNVAPVAPLLDLQSTHAGASWTASIAYETGAPGWLAQIPGGTGSQQVPLQISPLPEGHYRARVSFEPVGGGVATRSVVALSVRAPRVAFVVPYIAVENEASHVTIRGFGFNALGAPQVAFDTTPGTNVELVSDTEIRVDVPGLPAGRYPVAVSAAGGAPPMDGSAELVVVAAPAFAYKALDRVGSANALRTNQIVYDAERQKIFLYDPGSSAVPGLQNPPTPGLPAHRVERYRFDGGAGDWIRDDPLSFAGTTEVPLSSSAIALSPDGRELLRTARQSITHFDPAGTHPADSMPLATVDGRGGLGSEIGLMGAAMANDGSFVGPAYRSVGGPLVSIAYRYDVVERAFYLLVPPASWTHAEIRTALPTPSGRSVPLVYTGAGIPQPRFDYSASDGTVTEVSSSSTLLPRIWGYSRDESVRITSSDDGMNERLDVAIPDSTMPGVTARYALQSRIDAAVVSPIGTRLYYYTTDDHRVHVLDLENPSSMPPNFFPELGTSAPIDPPGGKPQMLITPDGGNLIVAGKDRLIVMPAP